MDKMFNCDGHIRPCLPEDIRPGVVVRRLNNDGTIPPFSDTIICRVDDGEVFLARPYAFAHLGTHLSGVETYSVPIAKCALFHTVLLASGKAYECQIGS